MKTIQDLVTHLQSLNACQDSIKFVKQHSTPQAAWNACNKFDWLLFYINNTKPNDWENKLRLIAADIAESVLPIWLAKYPNDSRPAKAIATARTFAYDAAYAAYAAYAAAANNSTNQGKLNCDILRRYFPTITNHNHITT
jgi:hypothetical protein